MSGGSDPPPTGEGSPRPAGGGADPPCCATLADCLEGPGRGAQPTVFVSEDDVLMMTVALVDTPGGLAFFDHAILYCPFCGTALQTEADLKARTTD